MAPVWWGLFKKLKYITNEIPVFNQVFNLSLVSDSKKSQGLVQKYSIWSLFFYLKIIVVDRALISRFINWRNDTKLYLLLSYYAI